MSTIGIEHMETVVVGAGQQGCAVAAALQDLGHDAIVLERGEIGQAWARERWDSLVVGSGNRSVRFPGWEYDGADPDGRMPGRDVAWYLRRYARERGLRVREHTAVHAVDRAAGAADGAAVRFRTRFPGGVVESRNVVAALGGYARPRIPDLAADIGRGVTQLHSGDYRNPAGLPGGAVLVVGAGISGQEIADELLDAGREVFLALGRHRSAPRRYRGRHIHEWFHIFGLYQDFVARHRETGDVGGEPVLLGLPVVGLGDDGADLNVGTLAAKGATVVGSVRAAHGDVLTLRDNVSALAREAARSFDAVLDRIDAGLTERGFVAPPQTPRPSVDLSRITDYGERLSLPERGITAIVWCTGYGPDYRILPPEVLDGNGFPLQHRGTLGAAPGLYYAGLPGEHDLHQTGIPSCVENGRFVAAQIQIDARMRAGHPVSVLPG